ncbi:3-oxo-5-alpha-steroid 4-dehydrogenase-like protein [Tricladium varicosporioides]|nr:3-oxo-5-alpha-steroid 4-dehydrogenase-like protein [Hymenoscyphus varicosporioides]
MVLSTDPVQICRIFFTLGTAVDLGGIFIPSFRENIMNYGSRKDIREKRNVDENNFTKLIRYLATFQVPHSWFTHYYLVSVMSSIFWAVQAYNNGPVFTFLASYSKPKSATVTLSHVLLAWAMMSVQGVRRLYESLAFTKPSQAQMWIGLWIIGMAYYVVMGVAVWIEGIDTLCKSHSSDNILGALEFSMPAAKATTAIAIFSLGSITQFICHKHLAGLKKYSLPQHPLFRLVICPHYTSECLVYVAIAIMAAPQGYVLNRSVLAGLGFVGSNLGVTADSTKEWYSAKFGAKSMENRWRMIPYVY